LFVATAFMSLKRLNVWTSGLHISKVRMGTTRRGNNCWKMWEHHAGTE